ncbi:methyltransferase [Streptomyces sp. SID2999]|uniref:SCO2525 family SAM-dependent methyltransferase n=1 Tax=Streptomyces sp. SID2999 TaxID=2690258 RepID=UPI001371613D|nr:SCO2525 family SAM-dependent methyltransferase [Streptomyces sp. SID2999]MYZ08165.1 methyltransferase [Streptomyces sp. SID2999]
MDQRSTRDAAEIPAVEVAGAPLWEAFDPAAYVDANYSRLHADDASIMRICGDFFRRHFERHDALSARAGIDVGSGPNLYPALMLLPWCAEITLLDLSPANVEWLQRHTGGYPESWDAFWDVLNTASPYREITDPRGSLGASARVEHGDLFLLPEGRWGIGTMFFTAESMTDSPDVFRGGVRRFVESLLPGAPFAAAFMAGSRGYRVGGHFFPSCSVDERAVAASLAPYAADDLTITRLHDGHALREGYLGMILACGRRRDDTR